MLTLVYSNIPFNAYRIRLAASIADLGLSCAIVKVSFWSFIEPAAAVISTCYLKMETIFVHQMDSIEDLVILKTAAKESTGFSTAPLYRWKNQIIQKLRKQHHDIEMTNFHQLTINDSLRIEHTTYDACRQTTPPTANLVQVRPPETSAAPLMRPTTSIIQSRHSLLSEYPTRTSMRSIGDGYDSRRLSV